MEIRFTLNTKIDKNLIARIEEKANGGSINEAAKFLMRFWYEAESNGYLTASSQDLTDSRQIENESGEINLSGLDEINLEF